MGKEGLEQTQVGSMEHAGSEAPPGQDGGRSGREKGVGAQNKGPLAVLIGSLDVPKYPDVPPRGRQDSPGIPHPDAEWGPGQCPETWLPGEGVLGTQPTGPLKA